MQNKMSYTFDSWRKSDDNDWTSEKPQVYLSEKQKKYITAGWAFGGIAIGAGLGSLGGLEAALGCGSSAGVIGALIGSFIVEN